jgi:hypothetical protein
VATASAVIAGITLAFTVIFTVSGGYFALKQWNWNNKIKQAELINMITYLLTEQEKAKFNSEKSTESGYLKIFKFFPDDQDAQEPFKSICH